MYRLFSTIKRNTIPKAVREQVWLKDMGNKFEGKCYISWCNNKINVFDFTVGHNIPFSKGGTNKIDNLHAICCRCNSCMSNTYTIDEWNNHW